MNYYEHHLGDYARDTAHLTMLEHGAYRLLLDRYYATEAGIPADQAHRVARARTKEEKAAVDTVLAEFFKLVDGAWINKRTEEEIAKAQTKINAARKNGMRGGRPAKPHKTETEDKPSGFLVGSDSETQTKAHQTPDTNHQSPDGSTDTLQDSTTDMPPAPDSSGCFSTGDLTRPMVEAGIVRVNPGHPDMVALAQSGCTPDTVRAAIAEAKEATKAPGQGYVVAILKRWQSEPTGINNTPRAPPRESDKDRSRRETYEGLTGARNGKSGTSHSTIDVTATSRVVD